MRDCLRQNCESPGCRQDVPGSLIPTDCRAPSSVCPASPLYCTLHMKNVFRVLFRLATSRSYRRESPSAADLIEMERWWSSPERQYELQASLWTAYLKVLPLNRNRTLMYHRLDIPDSASILKSICLTSRRRIGSLKASAHIQEIVFRLIWQQPFGRGVVRILSFTRSRCKCCDA